MDIRAIKCSLGMDVLRCKSPEMVRKEIWASLLAYNLIRQAMLQTAYASGESPRRMAEEPSATEDACGKACEPNNSPVCLGTKSVSSVAACPDSLELESSPRQLSFTAAMQRLAASWVLVPSLSEAAADELRRASYKHLAKYRLGHRPNRVEPRAIKRRPKPHKLLTQPRAKARAALQSRAATRAAA